MRPRCTAAAHAACIASAASRATSTSAGEGASTVQAEKRAEKRCGVCRTPSALMAAHTSTVRSWMACRWMSVSSAAYTVSLGRP